MLLTVALRYGGIALQFVILLILARNLNPHDYGSYMLVLSAVLPTYFLLGFGVSETFVRDAPKVVARDDSTQLGVLVGASFAVAIGTAAGIALFGGLLVWLLPLSSMTTSVVAFMLAFFVANGLMFNGAQLLLGAGSLTLGAFFFYPAINLSLVVSAVPYVLLAKVPTFEGVALATSLAALLMAVVALVLVACHVRPRRPHLQIVWHLVRVGVRLSAARALYAAGIWLPTFIAGVVLAPTDAGYLGTAGRLAVAVGAVMAAVRFAIRPAIVRAFERQDHLAIKLICGELSTVTLTISGLALVVSALAGHSLISMTFGPSFSAAAPLLTILLLAIAIEAYAGPVDEVLKMTGQENRVLAIFCIAVPVAACALMGAAQWGVMAMAWVQVAYTLAVFGAMIVVVHREWGIWLHPILPNSLTSRVRQKQASRLEVDV
jgi:O-antigen/teichoic acid export membrane protein